MKGGLDYFPSHVVFSHQSAEGFGGNEGIVFQFNVYRNIGKALKHFGKPGDSHTSVAQWVCSAAICTIIKRGIKAPNQEPPSQALRTVRVLRVGSNENGPPSLGETARSG